MAKGSQRLKGRDGALPALNALIEAMDNAGEISSITSTKVVFGSVSVLLTMIRVRLSLLYVTICLRLTFDQESMISQQDHVDLGQNCAEICRVLDRGTKGKKIEDLSQSVHEAISQLTT